MPVYPCTGTERTYSSCICKVQEKSDKGTADREAGVLQGRSTGAWTSKCSKQFIRYMEEDNRPQVTLDVDYENGMGISVGRIREDSVYDWKFVGLSHNTVRGAAGGAVLCAELLKAQGYITKK